MSKRLESTQPNGEHDILDAERTADGSMTLQSKRFGQAYHSRHGARTESLHVFLRCGLDHRRVSLPINGGIRILEMGFGTGLNALLTLASWRNLPAGRRGPLTYIALEPHPVPQHNIAGLRLDQDAEVDAQDAEAVHARPNAHRHDVQWSNEARFTRLREEWQAFAQGSHAPFDLIFYDAFAPDSQPELWTEERFHEAHKMLAPGGVLVTYCAKGDVRRAMMAAGLTVEKLPGPPGKREMLRATRPSGDIALPSRFNVRVYFFLVSRRGPGGKSTPFEGVDCILVSEEHISGRHCTKWPGGGLEFGEGPMECAQREAQEELGQDIALGPLVHATGSFVRSAWRPQEQVLCHYYLARLCGPQEFETTEGAVDWNAGHEQRFRWSPVQGFNPEQLTFSTDRAAWNALLTGPFLSEWDPGHH